MFHSWNYKFSSDLKVFAVFLDYSLEIREEMRSFLKKVYFNEVKERLIATYFCSFTKIDRILYLNIIKVNNLFRIIIIKKFIELMKRLLK